MTTRRGFLGLILASAAAPAIVRAEVLMPVRPAGPVGLAPWVLSPSTNLLVEAEDVTVELGEYVARGEIGAIDGFQIRTYGEASGQMPPEMQKLVDESMGVTVAALRRVARNLERQRAPLVAGDHYIIAARENMLDLLRRHAVTKPVPQPRLPWLTT